MLLAILAGAYLGGAFVKLYTKSKIAIGMGSVFGATGALDPPNPMIPMFPSY